MLNCQCADHWALLALQISLGSRKWSSTVEGCPGACVKSNTGLQALLDAYPMGGVLRSLRCEGMPPNTSPLIKIIPMIGQ